MEHYELFVACFPELDISETAFARMAKVNQENRIKLMLAVAKENLENATK